jgi:WD40 repeat protein
MTLTGHADVVYSVAFSLDEKSLASASDDKTIKLWEAVSSEMRSDLKEALQ